MNQNNLNEDPTRVRNLVLARSLRTVGPARRAGNKAQWQWLALDGWDHRQGWLRINLYMVLLVKKHKARSPTQPLCSVPATAWHLRNSPCDSICEQALLEKNMLP
jgi:hypothetical protein